MKKIFNLFLIVLVFVWAFTYALPGIYPYLMNFKIYRTVNTKDIDSGALFYTESDISIESERKLLKE